MNNINGTQQLSSIADYQQAAKNLGMSSSPAANSERGLSTGLDSLRQMAMKDFSIIENLVNAGVINPAQGQHLMGYVLNKAKELMVTQRQAGMQAPTSQNAIIPGLEAFLKENPEFFNQNGRAQVLNYLRNSNAVVDKDEILQISQIVEALEQSAIEGYLQKQAHAKSLNDENEAAKQKLRANAQNSNAADVNARVFTREQIGKMSGAEFAKNERAIMDQLRKGLIR